MVIFGNVHVNSMSQPMPPQHTHSGMLALLRTWTVGPPDSVMKKIGPDCQTCKIGVILRGHFYVYKCGQKRVDFINKCIFENLKVGMLRETHAI